MKKDMEYAKIISKNLRRIMYDADRKPSQVSKDLGIPKTTISGWINGNPRKLKDSRNSGESGIRPHAKCLILIDFTALLPLKW